MENVRSVERALEILECFSKDRKEVGLSELSRVLVLPKATVYRLARTLESQGYLLQNPTTQTYRLGPKVLGLAHVFLAELDYREIALPYMEELRNIVHESVSLYIANGEQRICVQRVEGLHALRQVVHIGDRLPIHEGASGKILTVFQDLKKYIQQFDPEVVKQIREQGYAVSYEEKDQGLTSISVPILNHSSQVIAALVISGPIFRFSASNIQRFVKEMLKTANHISYQLGYLQ